MHRRVFFRDDRACVTSTELVIDSRSIALAEIKHARAVHRRALLPFLRRYVLLITTAEGEREILAHRNSYLVFQLARALESALREARGGLQKEAMQNNMAMAHGPAINSLPSSTPACA